MTHQTLRLGKCWKLFRATLRFMSSQRDILLTLEIRTICPGGFTFGIRLIRGITPRGTLIFKERGTRRKYLKEPQGGAKALFCRHALKYFSRPILQNALSRAPVQYFSAHYGT